MGATPASVLPWLLLAAALSIVASGESVTLTEANIEQHLSSNKFSLLLFHATWCKHCQAFVPEFDAAAPELAGLGISTGKVDEVAEKAMKSRFKIRHFPTLLWLEGSKQTLTPNPGVTRDSIVVEAKRLLHESTTPAVVEVSEAPPPAKHKPNLVVYAEEPHASFIAAAKHRRSMAAWYFVRDSSKSGIQLQHKGEGARELSKGLAASENEIGEFFRQNRVPLLGILDADNFAAYMAGEHGLLWCLFSADGDRGEMEKIVEQHRAALLPVAKEVEGKYGVLFTDAKDYAQAIAGYFGQISLPAVVLMPSITVSRINNGKPGPRAHFRHSGALTTEAILQFLAETQQGKASVWQVEGGRARAEL